MATARGDVNAGDSAHTYAFKGEYLIYDREQEILTMPDRPRLFQFETHKDSTVDTVTIEARRIIFNKKESFAEAYKDVKLTQKDMIVTCDTGYFDRKNNWLSLTGHPTCDMKNYHLTGDSIFMVLDSTGKQLQSALVIRNAHGVQQEEDKRGTPGHVTEAFGDTLYAEFNDGKIERLYVNLNRRFSRMRVTTPMCSRRRNRVSTNWILGSMRGSIIGNSRARTSTTFRWLTASAKFTLRALPTSRFS